MKKKLHLKKNIKEGLVDLIVMAFIFVFITIGAYGMKFRANQINQSLNISVTSEAR